MFTETRTPIKQGTQWELKYTGDFCVDSRDLRIITNALNLNIGLCKVLEQINDRMDENICSDEIEFLESLIETIKLYKTE